MQAMCSDRPLREQGRKDGIDITHRQSTCWQDFSSVPQAVRHRILFFWLMDLETPQELTNYKDCKRGESVAVSLRTDGG